MKQKCKPQHNTGNNRYPDYIQNPANPQVKDIRYQKKQKKIKTHKDTSHGRRQNILKWPKHEKGCSISLVIRKNKTLNVNEPTHKLDKNLEY